MATTFYDASVTPRSASPMTPGRVASPVPGRRAAKQINGPWADEPMLLMQTPSKGYDLTHPAIHIANDFTQSYNSVLRALNAIYLQAPHVKKSEDIVDFLFLVHSWYDWVMGTQVLRQKHLFPEFDDAIGRPGYLTQLLQGDLDYGRAIQSIGDFAETTFKQPETYDPSLLRRRIEELAPSFQAYFAELIGTLMAIPSVCGARGGEADVRANRLLNGHVQFEKYLKDCLDKYTVQPMMLQTRDTTFEGGNTWPGLSVPAVHAVVDRLSPRHARSWRFLPCDAWGKPRELPFLGDERGKPRGSRKFMPTPDPESSRASMSGASVMLPYYT